MAVDDAQLAAIAAAINDPAAPDLAARLRAAFPALTFTVCADDDVIRARPVVERERFNLYLVDGSSHCMSLTSDAAVASGVVVAEVTDAVPVTARADRGVVQETPVAVPTQAYGITTEAWNKPQRIYRGRVIDD